MNDHELTERILDLWKEVLGVDDIEPDEDFFDAGGDSISAIRMLPELERRLGVEASVALIFDHSTAEELARALGVGSRPR